jgi:hypothetical protein
MTRLFGVLQFLCGITPYTPPKTELDFRRQYAAKHNPGFDPKARAETARLHGLRI